MDYTAEQAAPCAEILTGTKGWRLTAAYCIIYQIQRFSSVSLPAFLYFNQLVLHYLSSFMHGQDLVLVMIVNRTSVKRTVPVSPAQTK